MNSFLFPEPTLLLIDRTGDLRAHELGQVDDLVVGAAIQQLIDEPI